MAKSQETYNKKEKEKKRLQKRQEKAAKTEERKSNPGASDFDSMIAYVDEYGNITSTPPDPSRKLKVARMSMWIPSTTARSIFSTVPKDLVSSVKSAATNVISYMSAVFCKRLW